MPIQISWLLQKPTDLDLHCLQRQDIYGFSRTRVKALKSLKSLFLQKIICCNVVLSVSFILFTDQAVRCLHGGDWENTINCSIGLCQRTMNKFVTDDILNFLVFFFLAFHANPLLGRQSTWNAKYYFLWKILEKIKMLFVAVMISTLRV